MTNRSDDRPPIHAVRLDRLRLSPQDWRRIRAQAERTARGAREAALADLDGPWRVGAFPLADRRYYSGDMIGTLHGQAILAWPKT